MQNKERITEVRSKETPSQKRETKAAVEQKAPAQNQNIIAYKIDDETFAALMREAKSKREAAQLVGYKSPHEIAFKYIFQRCKELDIDTSHWSPCAWAGRVERTYENTFCKNSTACQDTLRKKIIAGHYKEYKCVICGNPGHWNNKPLVLRLDHINGDRTDARMENLRWICGNCDALLDTFCGRNQKQLRAKMLKTGTIAARTKEEALKEEEEIARSKKLPKKKTPPSPRAHRKPPKTKNCPICGEPITHDATYCVDCAHKKSQKVERPSKKELLKQLEKDAFTTVGKRYGVSDQAVRKWLKRYGLTQDEIKEIARKSRNNRKKSNNEK